MEIRPIQESDFKEIAELTNQLGSKVNEQTVKYQITEINRNPDHYSWVAVIDNKIVGYIHCFKAIRLTSEPFIEISGLIVDKNYRGNKIGRQLVQKAEGLIGNGKVRVRCNAKRELAHKFYYNIDYTLSKVQKIFEKKISKS